MAVWFLSCHIELNLKGYGVNCNWLEELETYIKLAVDVERNILAGGGEFHADCQEALLEDGSHQENVWGLTGIRNLGK